MIVEANLLLVVLLRAIQATGLLGSSFLNRTVSAFFGVSFWSISLVGFTSTFLVLLVVQKFKLPQYFYDATSSLFTSVSTSTSVNGATISGRDLVLLVLSKLTVVACARFLHGPMYTPNVNIQIRALDGVVTVCMVLGAAKIPTLGYQPAKTKTAIVVLTAVVMTLVWLKIDFPFSLKYFICIPLLITAQIAHYLLFFQQINKQGVSSKWQLIMVICFGLAVVLLPICLVTSGMELKKIVGPLSKLSTPLNRYLSVAYMLVPVEVNLIEYWTMASCSPDLYAMLTLCTSLLSFVASNWLNRKVPLHAVMGQWVAGGVILIYLYVRLREWMIARRNNRVLSTNPKPNNSDDQYATVII